MVGITTGVDLENGGRDVWTSLLSGIVTDATLVVFTAECILKIIGEAYQPWRYFIDQEYGIFNCFDFTIVLLSYIVLEDGGGGISALRMLRLVRLLAFIKHISKLRILVSGLVQVPSYIIPPFPLPLTYLLTYLLICLLTAACYRLN
jgi:hypothetical protein